MILKKVTIQDIDQFAAWSYILHESVDLKRQYINPTRTDKSPGCKFMVKNNELVLMDFSKGTGMNCGQAYMKIHNVGYLDALKSLYMITKKGTFIKNIDLKILEKVKNCTIQITPKSYTKKFLTYWGVLGVSEDQLKRESTRVYEVKSYSLKFEYNKTYYPSDLVFAYKGQDGFKIYFPERDKPRFKSSLTESDVWQVVRNPGKWIIAKSHKDLLALESLTQDTDFSIGMVQNEGSYPKVKEWQSAHLLYTLFDNDNAGILAGERFREFYLNAVNWTIPKELGFKDITDYIIGNDLDKAKILLDSFINENIKFPNF